MALREGGTLYLGLPFGLNGSATQGARYYDEARFAALADGWDVLAVYSPPVVWRCCPFPFGYHAKPGNHSAAVVAWRPAESFWAARPFGRDHAMYHCLMVMRPTRRAVAAALERIERAMVG